MEALLLFLTMLFSNPSTVITDSNEQSKNRIRVENSFSNARESNTRLR